MTSLNLHIIFADYINGNVVIQKCLGSEELTRPNEYYMCNTNVKKYFINIENDPKNYDDRDYFIFAEMNNGEYMYVKAACCGTGFEAYGHIKMIVGKCSYSHFINYALCDVTRKYLEMLNLDANGNKSFIHTLGDEIKIIKKSKNYIYTN